MDWIEFGSKAIEHLAWPVVVGYVVVTQKKPIAELIDRIKKFKIGSAEAEIGAKTEAAAEKIEERAAKPVEAPKLDPSALEHVVRDADTFDPSNAKRVLQGIVQGVPEPVHRWPRPTTHQHAQGRREERLRASGVFIEEWANLEETIQLLAATKGYQDARTTPIPSLIRRLIGIGVISPSTADSIKDLRRLRNQVAHTQIEPTREAAENFADSCWKVEKRLVEEEAAWHEAATKLADEMIEELGKPK